MSEPHQAEPSARPATARSREPDLILRFVRSERALHWALAIPFVALYVTALVMLLAWGEAPPRTIRTAFSWAHRIFGLALLVLPPLVLTRGFREWRVHLENFREGWHWDRNDFRWLVLMPIAAVNKRITLPDQGKFNAAEKLNFMMVSATYPLYIVTGILIWMPGVSFVPWLVHLAMAAVGLGLVAGHIFMATVNPGTRVGLSGMITGFVDREWARHHYRRWYDARQAPATAGGALPLHRKRLGPSSLRCPSCSAVHSHGTWEELARRVFQVEPVFCPECREAIFVMAPDSASGVAEAILGHAELATGEPFEVAVGDPAPMRAAASEAA